MTDTGDNLPKIDIKIRRIKEICCSIIAELSWNLPNLGVKDLVAFVISRINTRRTKGLPDNIFPRVKFTGIKIDYKREYKPSFSNYIEAYNPHPRMSKNDMNVMRTEPCIALYPSANKCGCWVLWNAKTKYDERRTHWVKPKYSSEEVINAMNDAAREEATVGPVETEPEEEVDLPEDNEDI